jgi:hypothetical protein
MLNSRGLSRREGDDEEYRRALHNLEFQPHVPNTEIEQIMLWGDNPTTTEFDQDILDIVESCIQQVPEPHQKLLRLRFSDQLTYNEITKLMGYSSKSHTWYHVQKALGILKEILLIDPIIRRKYDMPFSTKPTTWQEAAEKELDVLDSNIAVLDYHHSADMVEELSIRARYIGDLVRRGVEDTEQWYRHLAYMLMACGNIAARKMYCLRKWDMNEMLDLLASKQHDYGHGNITAFGLLGVAVRMSDKIARLENLVKRDDDAVNEPLLDTYMDIVGYAVIAGMLLNNTFELELA